MEIPGIMINDAIKKSTGYKYYKQKRNESAKGKAAEEPKEQHVSLVKSKRGKEKQPVGEEGSSAAHNKYYEFENTLETNSDATRDSLRSNTDEERDDETGDSDMDLSNNEPKADDVVSLLNETPVYELTDIMSHPVYIDAHTTLVVHNPEGNPEIISYKSSASEVPCGTHVDVQATNLVLQDILTTAQSSRLCSGVLIRGRTQEEDEDEDPEEDPADDDDEEEEHPAPADSTVVALPAADQAPSAEETEPFESCSLRTHTNHIQRSLTYRVIARISIPAPVPTPVWSNAKVARLLAISTPPSSPLSPWSSPLSQIPSPPLPPIPSPSHTHNHHTTTTSIITSACVISITTC
ncbi:hypothetical protein Tco_0781092 [Tanacetum coccineum]